MKKQNLIWLIPIICIGILIYAWIEVIKQDSVKADNKIILEKPSKKIIQSKPPPQLSQLSNITFTEVDTLYDKLDFSGCSTDLQKQARRNQFEEMIKRKYLGKLVQWRGKVVDVDKSWLEGKLYIKFKHTDKSLISDVTVFFPNSERKKLLKLQKGNWVTYQGRIRFIEGTFSNHELVNGKIIRVQKN